MIKMSEKDVVLAHFKKVDPKLFKILAEINLKDWLSEEILDGKLIFYSLCRTIVGQQLAGKAADAIFKRFEMLMENEIKPEKVLKTEEQKIRDVGLSWAKVRSVKDLSARVMDRSLVLENLEGMSNEDLINELSKVKGIGRWTAEMFLMFRLGREDIFSWGDLGLKNGLKKYLGKDDLSKEEMEESVSTWAPYRTYGAIAMWHLLDNR